MSLINQVLQDLDKRGANTNIGEATIRVVHKGSHTHPLWLVAGGAAGMLGAAGAVWMLWQSHRQPVDTPAPVVIAAPAVSTLPVSQPAITAIPVQLPVPRIDNVTPVKLVATGLMQTVTLHGSNFQPGANVTLIEEGGAVYEKRPIISLSNDTIILNLNFGKQAGNWKVEVLGSDGASSGYYHLAVGEPVVVTQVASHAVAASAPAIADKPKVAKPKPDRIRGGTAGAELLVTDGVSKQPTQITLQQQAENEYRRAFQLMRSGRASDAMSGFEAALLHDAGHEQARQALVGLLLEKKSHSEAEKVLKDGLQYNNKQINLAMLLARLQVERGDIPTALDTLILSLPHAEKHADYLSFVAALMQRQTRNKEAIGYYHKALKLKPNTGVWLMGLGISLRAEQFNAEAQDAFKQALATNTLNTELQSFVTQQLKEF